LPGGHRRGTVAADLRTRTGRGFGQVHCHPRNRQARLQAHRHGVERVAAHPGEPQEPARNRRIALRNPPLASRKVKGTCSGAEGQQALRTEPFPYSFALKNLAKTDTASSTYFGTS